MNRLFTGSLQAASLQAGGFMMRKKVYSDILPWRDALLHPNSYPTVRSIGGQEILVALPAVMRGVAG
jgi:hypothetical protein